MKLKLLAAASALSVSSAFAAPAITELNLGPLTSGVPVGGLFSKPVGEFLDLFNFTVTQPSVGVAAVLSVPLDIPLVAGTEFNIDFFAPSLGLGGIALLDATGSTILVSDTNSSDGLNLSGSIAAGDYKFAVLGNANGTLGGTYVGYLQTLAAVPEPETYAMLMAGLLAIGAVSRRRRQG